MFRVVNSFACYVGRSVYSQVRRQLFVAVHRCLQREARLFATSRRHRSPAGGTGLVGASATAALRRMPCHLPHAMHPPDTASPASTNPLPTCFRWANSPHPARRWRARPLLCCVHALDVDIRRFRHPSPMVHSSSQGRPGDHPSSGRMRSSAEVRAVPTGREVLAR